MKHTRYDSEYDKVRKRSGLAKPEFDFDDLQPAKPRAAPVDEDYQKRMAERVAIETAQAAERRAEMDSWRAKANREAIMREYNDLGLTPPEPLVSLSLLESIGWKVEKYGDRWELIRPEWADKQRRKSNEKAEADRGDVARE
jgi:hypothetical protein